MSVTAPFATCSKTSTWLGPTAGRKSPYHTERGPVQNIEQASPGHGDEALFRHGRTLSCPTFSCGGMLRTPTPSSGIAARVVDTVHKEARLPNRLAAAYAARQGRPTGQPTAGRVGTALDAGGKPVTEQHENYLVGFKRRLAAAASKAGVSASTLATAIAVSASMAFQ
jgi:hypothetical protein